MEETTYKLEDFQKYEYTWRHNGRSLEDPTRFIKLEDAIATTDAPVFLPQVIENIVKEAAEPLLVGASLLRRVEWKYGRVVTMPAVGAMTAFDIAEGEEYPDTGLNLKNTRTNFFKEASEKSDKILDITEKNSKSLS
jgi:hypothetical protein